MSWKEQQTDAIASLAKVLKDLTDTDVDALVRKSELGTTLAFSAGVPLFEQTISLMRRLKDVNLDFVPTQKIRDLTSACKSIYDRFQEIRAFNPDQGRGHRDSLIQSLEDTLYQNFVLLTSVIASSGQDEAAIRKQRDEATQIVQSLSADRREIKRILKETKDQSKTILDQAQKTAASIGVHSHAEHFQKEADKYLQVSQKWLYATSGLATVAAAISVWTINTVTLDSGWVTVVHMIFGRFSLMALAYFVAIWASRMYRAARHNEVVNRHRVNALKTFETFASAARDDPAKDAVLMRATECIFSHQASGFSDSRPDAGSTRIVSAVPSTLSGPQATPAPGSTSDTTS